MLHMKKAFMRMEEGLAIFSRFPILTSDYILLYRYIYNIMIPIMFIYCTYLAVYCSLVWMNDVFTLHQNGSRPAWLMRWKCMTEQTVHFTTLVLCSLFLFVEPVVTAVDLPMLKLIRPGWWNTSPATFCGNISPLFVTIWASHDSLSHDSSSLNKMCVVLRIYHEIPIQYSICWIG